MNGDLMLTPKFEREVLSIRCQIRREEVMSTFINCPSCHFYRPAAPTKQKICVDCYAKALERAVHVAEASVEHPDKQRRQQVDHDLLTMFTLGMGVTLGLILYWVISQWS